jgi:hypothetical protein
LQSATQDIRSQSAIVVLFATFIICCGLTHALNVLDHWKKVIDLLLARLIASCANAANAVPLLQIPPLPIIMKFITGVISYITAVAVYKLLPLALIIPSPVQLQKEINIRKKAEDKLHAQVQYIAPDHVNLT